MSHISSSSPPSSHRPTAMVLALVAAVVLSPFYSRPSKDDFFWRAWSSGLVLPAVLAGLIIAIRTTSSSNETTGSGSSMAGSDSSSLLRIGSSSWGLGGVLVMLVLVLSWQHSVQEFLWK